MVIDKAIVESAILGYEHQIGRLQNTIALLRNGNIRTNTPEAEPTPTPVKKRVFSAATRKAMSDAQRKRWRKIRRQG